MLTIKEEYEYVRLFILVSGNFKEFGNYDRYLRNKLGDVDLDAYFINKYGYAANDRRILGEFRKRKIETLLHQ